ncbi:MAG: hypothetical protein ACLFPX_02265 [Candidatus Omnitrophota bacterium]
MFTALKRRKIVQFLRQTDYDRLLRHGEQRLIKAFQRAARQVPAYRQILSQNHVPVSAIQRPEHFQAHVPVIDKKIFSAYPLADLCCGGRLDKVAAVMSSSGFSGSFSYSLSTQSDAELTADVVDALLDARFDAFNRKTLFISCLGMGVKVPTRLPLAEVGQRADIALAVIEKLQLYYEQIIIIGNTYFLKKLIEDGRDRGLDWPRLRVHVIMGEDWFPESYRDYLSSLLGISMDHPHTSSVMSTMGISELGISLFQEDEDLVRIRRMAVKNEQFSRALFGRNLPFTPLIFYYNPLQVYVEEVEGELVFSNLSPDAILPLMRYAPHDLGGCISRARLKNVLHDFGVSELMPSWPLPLVWVGGRAGKTLDVDGQNVTPEQIKALLYSHPALAQVTTGYFHLSGKRRKLVIEIQLKPGIDPDVTLHKTAQSVFSGLTPRKPEITIYPYIEFPYGIELNYEGKFRYVG